MADLLNLDGQHIFIAGGGRGIGAASARLAAKAGAAVTVNYVTNAHAANRLVEEIVAAGGKAWAVGGDISEPGVAERMLVDAAATGGTITGLVVSAGIFEGAAIEEMTAEFWDRTFAINVRGTFLAVQAAAAQMRVECGGSIVIYTSTAGQRGSSVYSAYASSKAAQIIFMRSMAKELAPQRIRVNCIAPAWTETDMTALSLDELGRDNVAKDFPLGRIGLPADIAGATVFLLSDLAEFITGSTITVDGGMDMRG